MTTNVLIVGYGAFGAAIHKALSSRDDLKIGVLSRSGLVDGIASGELHRTADSTPIDKYDIVVVALPSHAMKATLSSLCKSGVPRCAFVSCAKGIDGETRQFPSQIILSSTGSSLIGVMSGASFANEMMQGRPVFLSFACQNRSLGTYLCDKLRTPLLRLSFIDDVRGLEICSVGKNILAVGAGIVDGLALGDNFKAAFVAQGVIELCRIVQALGGRAETVLSVGALGDVILTTSSAVSRNYSHGRSIVSNHGSPTGVIEGARSITPFVDYITAHNIRSPYFESLVRATAEPDVIRSALDSSGE